ncbi:MAG: sodium:solute symporter family protein, partial [Thermoplasmatota archaeon]
MVDWSFPVLFAIYLIFLLVVGWRSRSSKDPEDFFLASRSLSHRSVAFSLGATVVGGSAVIVTGSLVYTHGLAGLWYDIGGIMGLLILGLFIAPRIRGMKARSLPDLLGMSFGRSAKVGASLLLVLVEIGWVALLMQATRFILAEALGLSPSFALLMAALVFILYTLIGGHRAVVRTDKIQMVVAIAAMGSILAGLLLKGAQFQTSKMQFPTSDHFTPSLVISAFLVMLLSHVVGPDIYSKVFSSRSTKDARRGVLGGAFLKILSSLLVGSIALLAASIYGGTISGGEVFPTAAAGTLPPLLFSVAMLGLVSVMLSSADSCLISGATFLSWDLLGDRTSVLARSLAVTMIGSISYLVAFHSSGLLETLTLSYTLFSAGMVPAVFLSIWKKKLGLRTIGALAS